MKVFLFPKIGRFLTGLFVSMLALSVFSANAKDENVNQAMKPFVFEEYMNGGLPNFSGSKNVPVAWFDDESYLQWLSLDDYHSLYVVEAVSGKVVRPLVPEKNWEILASVPSLKEDWKNLRNLSMSRMDSKFGGLWFEFANDLYYMKLDGSYAKKLTSSPGKKELVTFSPDGKYLAYIYENNLWVVDVNEGIPRALTNDGSDTILNGKASWVYYEEIYNRNWRTYWWSPNSRKIIFYRSDESSVPIYNILHECDSDHTLEKTRYPRAGEENPKVKVCVVDVKGKSPISLNLQHYGPEVFLVSRAGFTQDNRPWVVIQDRIQSWLDFVVDGKRIFRDSTIAWIGATSEVFFLQDGTLITTSPRNGFYHLYAYDKDGNVLWTTSPNLKYELNATYVPEQWNVKNVKNINENKHTIYFTADKDNSIGEDLYSYDWETKELHRLTSLQGTHSVILSPSGKYFVDSWSNWNNPGQMELCSTECAENPVRVLDENVVPVIHEYQWGKSEAFTITLKDGFPMQVGWILPPKFDAQKKYPVWMPVYCGPEMPTIRDTWAGGRISDQTLATEDVIVFYADPRTASAKGAIYAWPCYKNLFVQEQADLSEAIEWLGKQEFIDSSKIGMDGYSYGGSMTIWMMTHTDLLAAGIAGGSLSTMREYDSVYTERFMDIPLNNLEGYDNSSLAAAAKLHGNLLLIHGNLDDNVHPANSWRFAYALQQANIPFQQMVYPNTRHAYGGKHHYNLMRSFIRNNVK